MISSSDSLRTKIFFLKELNLRNLFFDRGVLVKSQRDSSVFLKKESF
jgi:hypothetical protein